MSHPESMAADDAPPAPCGDGPCPSKDTCAPPKPAAHPAPRREPVLPHRPFGRPGAREAALFPPVCSGSSGAASPSRERALVRVTGKALHTCLGQGLTSRLSADTRGRDHCDADPAAERTQGHVKHKGPGRAPSAHGHAHARRGSSHTQGPPRQGDERAQTCRPGREGRGRGGLT